MEGLDYTNMSPSAAKALRAKFVVRYLGNSWKCATRGEVHALQAIGIAVGLVYETTGTTFTGGHAAGLLDGQRAAAAATALGAPAGTPIWFAIDTDTTYGPVVQAYYQGCVDGSGAYKARLYAGFKVIHGMAHGGHWQTYAWSNGLVSAHADLYQYKNLAAYDHDRTLNGNLVARGGWLTFAQAPAPVSPSPAPVILPPETITYQGYHYTRGDKV